MYTKNWFELQVLADPKGVLFQLGLDPDFQKSILETESNMDLVISNVVLSFVIQFCADKGLDFSEELERALKGFSELENSDPLLDPLLEN